MGSAFVLAGEAGGDGYGSLEAMVVEVRQSDAEWHRYSDIVVSIWARG